jgi:omega-hydroxy-beta-dihydromenaquinone-9 sulfotransferase
MDCQNTDVETVILDHCDSFTRIHRQKTLALLMNKTESSALNTYPSWAPRFWHGMRAKVWWRLLRNNRFQISWPQLHIAVGASLINPVNDLLWGIQHLIYGRRIRASRLDSPPIFILGHWRSGTTLLHELLVTNPAFSCPNTYQCLAPSHFLVSGRIITRFGGFLLPEKRPMDEMAAGWLLPQEDEFALMNLGIPSPYLRMAFPHTQDKFLDYLDLQQLSDQQLNQWREGFQWFLKALSIAWPGKRLVLKSPTHTGRVAELYRMFPEAKFVHLTRDPRKLFPSTMKLWRSLDEVQSLQEGYNEDQLIEYVRQCMDRMYSGFNAGRAQIPASHIMDLRYEDLVADPKSAIRDIYQCLQLGNFDEVAPNLDQKLVGHQQYRTNKHSSDPDWERQIMDYCADYAKRFGYV